MADRLACKRCGKIQSILKRCTRCQKVVYCSRACQVKDWTSHKDLCNKNVSESPSIRHTLNAKNFSKLNTEMDSATLKTIQHSSEENSADMHVSNVYEGENYKGQNISTGRLNNQHQCYGKENGPKSGGSHLESVQRRLEQHKCFQSENFPQVSSTTDKKTDCQHQDPKDHNQTTKLPEQFDHGTQKQTVAENVDMQQTTSKVSGVIMFECKEREVTLSTSSRPSSSKCMDGPLDTDTKQLTSTIIVKGNKEKHKLPIQKHWSGEDIMQQIAHTVQIPLSKLKLICQGKLMGQGNIKEFITEKAVFQALGEKAESEEGLEKQDIEVVMKQMNIDRNTAIKALRKTDNVIDAIIELGNR
ncbi:nascent polypeptide-associated complex subunit alpha-like [Lingula anatina]|uniref:Nascent polypeptide-associated complex subunit alpha-like n=1 Tax=Lingula anatina TaxID=7574 RepID=A0A1S3I0L8_LINAN|nr:nascent polypeptide-associated complex subunit alpha-like [Lingula anatina]|eukprot:XP_013391371.1 nascent polypeptide-associated complex subunit alpha-like [Lingula anatina]